MGHWFDGDGAILAVNFNEGKASANYKYVQTDAFIMEEKADKLLLRNYGTNPGFFTKLFNKGNSNRANTSVLPLEEKLLALWEGGFPVSLDLETLKTLGYDDLGFLKSGHTFSAHPKVDAKNKVIYNFGF